MSVTNDGGPAFPTGERLDRNGSVEQYHVSGMSLRDWFSGMALQGLLVGYWESSISVRSVAGMANELADAMLSARGQAEADKKQDSEWSEWIAWGGGECPVQPETRVCIRVRDGWEDWEENAGWWEWKHLGAGGDIVAYRVRKGGSK